MEPPVGDCPGTSFGLLCPFTFDLDELAQFARLALGS
jgi:hypothetical protein